LGGGASEFEVRGGPILILKTPMNPQVAQNYLRTKVLTATPEQLQLLLFDGAIRYIEQARPALEQKNYQQSHTLITRAQKIVNQLLVSLNKELAPELCSNLAAVYTYVYRRLMVANTSHTVGALNEAAKLMKYQRETWVMLLQKLAQTKAGLEAQKVDAPAPDPRMEASISMQG
jgi:flagellar protein FliS